MKKNIIIIILSIIIVGLGVLAYFLLKPTNEITVTFDSDGGTIVQKMKVKKGESITLPTTTKEGFNLLGWYKDDEKIDDAYQFMENVTLTAKWEKVTKTFVVSFDSKGGSAVSSITLECGKELTLPKNPTRSGYTFVSWEDKNGRVINDQALFTCENVTLYANWQEAKKIFTVSFNSDGGSSVKAITVECDKALPKLSTPTKSGYNFVEWQLDGKKVQTGDKLSCNNVTLKAKWEKEVTYSCPDGYKLDGTKCTTEGTVKEKCPDGTKVDGTLCINTSITNSGTRVCKQDTVSIDGKGHTWTGKGDYYFYGNSYGKCAYYKWTQYTTQTQCTNASDINHKTTWVSDLNGCYAETKMGNYETVCASDYQYYSSSDLSSKFGIHDNGKCLKKVSKVKYCDSPYTLTNGKCLKTIDATLK